MNLKPAPFALTEGLVAALLGAGTSSSTRIVQVPVLPVKLVDRPRRSEDPRLAKANDDGGATMSNASAIPPGFALAEIDEAARSGNSQLVFGGEYFAIVQFQADAWRFPNGVELDFEPTHYRVEARP